MKSLLPAGLLILLMACNSAPESHEDKILSPGSNDNLPPIDYTLTKDQTHNKFSSVIPPVIKVKSGAVIEAFTEDASDEQLSPYFRPCRTGYVGF